MLVVFLILGTWMVVSVPVALIVGAVLGADDRLPRTAPQPDDATASTSDAYVSTARVRIAVP